MFLKLRCHFVLELLIIISGLSIFTTNVILHQYNVNDTYQMVALLPDAVLIICILIYIPTQVNFEPFHALLRSYRSMIIIISTIFIIVCDITTQALNDNPNIIDIIRTIFDNITYTNTVVSVLFIDCVANIANISRTLFPTVLIAITAFNMYLSYNTGSDENIFKYENGSISIEEIQRAAYASIILYCIGCVYRVFVDARHEKFTMLAKGIPRKTVLKSNLNLHISSIGQIQFCCFDIPLWIYYGLIFFCIAIVLILFICRLRNEWILGSLVVCQIYLIINCLYQHFDFYIMKKWFFQFRCLLLILSMIINIYCTVQKLLWNSYEYEDVSGILHVAFNLTTYNCAVFLCLCRDGMKQKFPLYFTIAICILLLFVSTWNVFQMEFDIKDINDKIPNWFIELEKNGYYQVNFVMLLILISLYYDRNHAYFVLIVEKRNRTDFYVKSKIYDVASSIINRQIWHKAKPSDKSSNILNELSRFYGSTSVRANIPSQNMTITPAPSDLNGTLHGLTSPPPTGSTPINLNDNIKETVELSSTHDTHQSSLKSPLLQDDNNTININHTLSLVLDISHPTTVNKNKGNRDITDCNDNMAIGSLPSDAAMIQFKND